jgi:hypothetical protein
MAQTPIEKKCGRCGMVKSPSDFGINNAKYDRLQSHCRACKREFQNRWYHKNKQTHVAVVSKNRRARTQAIREMLNAYLREHPCVECGETDPLMLDFDHVCGVKRAAVSQMVSSGYSWEAITLEIAKCEVRCVRCHRRKTAAQFGWHPS